MVARIYAILTPLMARARHAALGKPTNVIKLGTTNICTCKDINSDLHGPKGL